MMTTESMDRAVSLPSDDLAALVARFYREIFREGNLKAVEDMVAADFVDHIPTPIPGQPTQGPRAVTWFADLFRTAFPDLKVTVDDAMSIGDRVVTRATWRGTQTGKLLGADPTGKQAQVTSIDITRVGRGQVREHWGQMDVLSLIGQLGFLPGLW